MNTRTTSNNDIYICDICHGGEIGASTAPVLTPSESKVKDMILLSVDGMESNFDSDSLPNTEVISHKDPSYNPDYNLDEITHSPLGEQNKENVKETPNPPAKKIRFDTQDAADLGEASSETVTKWSQWKPASLRSRKHPALYKPKPKRPSEKVADAKMQKKSIKINKFNGLLKKTKGSTREKCGLRKKVVAEKTK